jgi:hypothetical protein
VLTAIAVRADGRSAHAAQPTGMRTFVAGC